MRALVTGATGLIGRALLRRLDNVVVLTRNPARVRGVEAHAWDPEAGPPPALRDIDVVFHLAGEPVAGGCWTVPRKRRIRDSRVLGTRHLIAALAEQARRPRVLVCASAVGFYGDRGDEALDERSAGGQGFLAEVCAAWEREALQARDLGVRVVCARFGPVLAPDGGALARMLPAFRLGLGGPLGSGRQWMSWIHVDDAIGLLLHAARVDQVVGPMNAVAPRPVTNSEFARALGRALHRPAVLRAPGFILRMVFGEMSDVLLASQRVAPLVAEESGYRFERDTIEDALTAALAAA